MITKYIYSTIATLLMLPVLTGCTGLFDGIYDEEPVVVNAEGQIYIDATSWSDWYYISLPLLHRLSVAGDTAALYRAQTEHEPYPIPMTLTKEHDGVSGQYLYWFDVWGEGIKRSEYREFTATDAQSEPAEWSFAVHRNNVRTNGGAVFETSYTSIDDLPESSAQFANADFKEDTWSENVVWDSQEQMLMCFVPSQGIKVNTVLSSWLTMDLPPIPPAFTHNAHVFILRMSDGTYAALQLTNYLTPSGAKCGLTIRYKYPYTS